ncbi:MAG TPA: 30S ribosomal protein S6 [Candidatus Hydrogenedentes bacterium]|nr:30S ribosomal protein S6 [Candidatus Hydrogenedentota bacterium]HPG67811.1 30S ribosomal protein S6 [Candidatus Hydrogenedentota bacterium]
MRTYEALYIVRPDIEDGEIQTVAKGVETLITTNGGAIVRSEIWGKRRLAYEVKKYTEGCYILVRFTAEPSFVSRLEYHFRLSEAVIRHLITYFDEKTLKLEAEQMRRREEEMRAGAEDMRRREERAGRRRYDDDDDDDDDDVTAPVAGPRRRRHPDADSSDGDDDDE